MQSRQVICYCNIHSIFAKDGIWLWSLEWKIYPMLLCYFLYSNELYDSISSSWCINDINIFLHFVMKLFYIVFRLYYGRCNWVHYTTRLLAIFASLRVFVFILHHTAMTRKGNFVWTRDIISWCSNKKYFLKRFLTY